MIIIIYINRLFQEGGMELFYRLVNYRDKGTQNGVRFGPQHHQEYQYPTINVRKFLLNLYNVQKTFAEKREKIACSFITRLFC